MAFWEEPLKPFFCKFSTSILFHNFSRKIEVVKSQKAPNRCIFTDFFTHRIFSIFLVKFKLSKVKSYQTVAFSRIFQQKNIRVKVWENPL